jgi:hypothetical protein
VRKQKEQLSSVLDWLVAHGHSRSWLSDQFNRSHMWGSRLFRGEIACSVPELVKLGELTGIDLRILAKECVK